MIIFSKRRVPATLFPVIVVLRNRYLLLFSGFFIINNIVSCNPEKKPLFTKLGTDQTGIGFINNNTDTDTLNILDYLYYYNGAGVATGDINNDGLPDIYFVSNQKGGNKLYLNKGNFHFEDITAKAHVEGNADWSTGVTMCDVNNDGYLDIYVCAVANHTPQGTGNNHTYFKNSRNQLFINKGDNTFQESANEWGLDIEGYNTQAVFFDYDKDGDLDMFLLQHSIHQTAVYGDTSVRGKYSAVNGGKLFRNDGHYFTNVTLNSGIISSVLGYGLGVAVADLNHDGYDDLYIGNDFHENDYYYLNNGNGTFHEMNREAFGHESRFSMGNDIADINNDGWPDIVTLDMLPEDEKVLKSSQGDESPDLYDLKIKRGYYYQYTRNCLQLNTGRGRYFSDIALYSHVAATDWSWGVLMADFDLDGINDIFISNGIKKRQNDLDYIKFVSNARIKKQIIDNPKIHDREMLQAQPSGEWHNYIYKGTPALQFEDRSEEWGLGTPSFSQGAAYADLDNDGDLDIVTNDMNASAGVYKNNTREQEGSGHFLNIHLQGTEKNRFAIGTKAFVFAGNQVFYRQLEPARGFMSFSEPLLHFGLGANQFADSIFIIWPNNRYERFLHVAANQKLFIKYDPGKTDTLINQLQLIDAILHSDTVAAFEDITSQSGIDFRHKEDVSFVDFNRQFLIPHAISTLGPKTTVGDVNGDGRDDFFVCGARNQSGQLFEQLTDGKFRLLKEPDIKKDSASEDVDGLLFDADNDNDLDLYVVSGGNEYEGQSENLKDRLYINDGKGNFTRSQTLPSLYQDKSIVRCGDFDGDGDLDLFVGGRTKAGNYGDIPVSYLLQNDGKGNFSIVTDKIAKGLERIGMVTDASWMDINKDGKMDLVIVGEWMPVVVFLNQNGKLVQQHSGLDHLTGWWNCMKKIDVNGDGYEDILLGNYGLNSKLKASDSFPLKMYLSDFDNNGSLDPVLCVEKGHHYYPFVDKEMLEKQLPYLKNKYLGYREMAGKTVEEIFGEKLDEAKLFEANTLQSVILINDKKGNFIVKILPLPFQLSPVFSFFAGDINGDNKTDILSGGNFYGVTPYEGRYDAMSTAIGFGDGNGGFNSPLIIPDELLIKGEIRDIKSLKVAGKKCLLLSRNNDSLILLELKNGVH